MVKSRRNRSSRIEACSRPHAPAKRVCEGLSERDRVALDGDVDVEAPLAEQDVSHCPSDQVDALVRLAERGHGLEHRRQPLELRQLVRQRNRRPPGRRCPFPECGEHVAAGDDTGELPAAQDGYAVVARGQKSL